MSYSSTSGWFRIRSYCFSFLLSLPLSIVLPYVFLGLVFRDTSCRGGMFCLPSGIECLWCLGFMFFAFPFVITYILLSFIFSIIIPNRSLKSAPFVVTPLAPFTGFTMAVDETLILTFFLAMIPQLLFWAVVVHLVRKMILLFIRIMLI